MLDVFDARDNEKLLAAIQELTSQLAVAQNKITELEKGSDVPTPTVADAGKVLKVGEDLSYELGEPDSPIIDITPEFNSGLTATISYTDKQIRLLIASGKTVRVYVNTYDDVFKDADIYATGEYYIVINNADSELNCCTGTALFYNMNEAIYVAYLLVEGNFLSLYYELLNRNQNE